MKKILIIFLAGFFIVAVMAAFLNINITIRQGIDYQWQTIRIPLYLKILNFIDRHYNYQYLAGSIIKPGDNQEVRVDKIFKWTHFNIKKQPAELPIIDDHVWHIIIRRYGTDDQFQDIFTTLCNYAGVEAFFSWVMPKEKTGKKIPLSFVRIKEKWYIFDAYSGARFKSSNGRLADIGMLKRGDYSIEWLDQSGKTDYSNYIDDLPLLRESGLTRASTQSPLNRLFLVIKRLTKERS